MSTLIMKFGGAAVENVERFSRVAMIILKRASSYKRIVVVVSAMGKTTDELMQLAQKVHPSPPKREQDMLVSVGERVSISLLAMALDRIGLEAISFTGSQSGIITTNEHTEAKIVDIRPKRLLPHLDRGKIVIVAGFQGMSLNGEITTLGRGGSDTSAVALAVALGAEYVEFYKDVPGIGAEDPKQCPETPIFSSLSYEEALSIIRKGAKVLHARSIELAQKNGIILQVRSFFDPEKMGTIIGQGRSREPSLCYETEEVALV